MDLEAPALVPEISRIGPPGLLIWISGFSVIVPGYEQISGMEVSW